MARLAKVSMGQLQRLSIAYPVLGNSQSWHLDASCSQVFVAIDEYVFNEICDQTGMATSSDASEVLKSECARLRRIAEALVEKAKAKKGV